MPPERPARPVENVDLGVRTEWSVKFVRNMRAQGKRLRVTLGDLTFADPDAVALRPGFLVIVTGSTTAVYPLHIPAAIDAEDLP